MTSTHCLTKKYYLNGTFSKLQISKMVFAVKLWNIINTNSFKFYGRWWRLSTKWIVKILVKFIEFFDQKTSKKVIFDLKVQASSTFEVLCLSNGLRNKIKTCGVRTLIKTQKCILNEIWLQIMKMSYRNCTIFVVVIPNNLFVVTDDSAVL